jgi:hypothetical protein
VPPNLPRSSIYPQNSDAGALAREDAAPAPTGNGTGTGNGSHYHPNPEIARIQRRIETEDFTSSDIAKPTPQTEAQRLIEIERRRREAAALAESAVATPRSYKP